MKNFLKKIYLYNVLFKLRKLLRLVYSTKSRSRFFWNLRKGDDILSLDYPLDKNSVVFIIGAYEGDYLSKLNNKYECKIYAFEPIIESFEILKNKFQFYENIKLYNFGLSDITEEVYFSKSGESSSLYREGSYKVNVLLKSFKDFLDESKIENIDLIYINIEGGEYRLLDSAIKNNLLLKVIHLQVQYHLINKSSRLERKLINKKLRVTHKRQFNFPFIWERWDIKNKKD